MNLQILNDLRNQLKNLVVPDEIRKKINIASPVLNSAGVDPWGLDPETLEAAAAIARWIYQYYFRVEVTGLKNLPQGRLMVIANHGCQIPLDALFVSYAMLLDAEPPKICRAMVDHWVPGLPFISELFTRCGEVVGAPHNCSDLLKNDNCVLIFPEGTKGSGKTIFSRYQLQNFGTGFMRIALETKAPILPVAVVGTEEIYPSLMNLKPIAKLLKFPYFPVTPFFPHFGLAGAIPLPCKVTLRFAKPIHFDESPDISEDKIHRLVSKVQLAIQNELNRGVKIRGNHIFTKAAI
ncbi:MAG: lysophospholipid acyltransferase family protein [Bdellovibrionota bacterium]